MLTEYNGVFWNEVYRDGQTVIYEVPPMDKVESMNDSIFHVTPRTCWSAAQKAGAYTADSLASEGFIHCSKADQILRVAHMLFAGQHGLVLLVVDPARLTSELRWDRAWTWQPNYFPTSTA